MEYHPRFRLILHTKYFNPHYKPEVQAQCTLINFLVTREGLEDQLLAAVVAKERPDLETLKVGARLGGSAEQPPVAVPAQPQPRSPWRLRGHRLVLCPAGDGPTRVPVLWHRCSGHSTRNVAGFSEMWSSADRYLAVLFGAALKGRMFN